MRARKVHLRYGYHTLCGLPIVNFFIKAGRATIAKKMPEVTCKNCMRSVEYKQIKKNFKRKTK